MVSASVTLAVPVNVCARAEAQHATASTTTIVRTTVHIVLPLARTQLRRAADIAFPLISRFEQRAGLVPLRQTFVRRCQWDAWGWRAAHGAGAYQRIFRPGQDPPHGGAIAL